MTGPDDSVPTAVGPGLLTGRRAVVTGGVGAIGQAIAGRFAAHGAQVVVADLDAGACAAVAGSLSARYGVPCHGVAMDVTDRDSVLRAAAHAEAATGGCDVVVVNAGVLVIKPALELTEREWRRVIDVNLTGAFHTATVFAAGMVAAARPGSVIFSSSLFGTRGGMGNSAYSASKFGLIGLAQSMAAELAGHGIRVNCVCPGQITSQMIEELFVRRAEDNGTSVAAERAAFTERIPLGRLGGTDEVADTYVYLASALSSYVTGQHLVVDGGWQVG
jgi:NAD(P)-dependent dehydrogenase (short-subunit alcohol dehydrogenase family)